MASPENWSEHPCQLVNQVSWKESCARGRLCAQGVMPSSVEPIAGQTLGRESRMSGFNTMGSSSCMMVSARDGQRLSQTWLSVLDDHRSSVGVPDRCRLPRPLPAKVSPEILTCHIVDRTLVPTSRTLAFRRLSKGLTPPPYQLPSYPPSLAQSLHTNRSISEACFRWKASVTNDTRKSAIETDSMEVCFLSEDDETQPTQR